MALNAEQTAALSQWADYPGASVVDLPLVGPVIIERGPYRGVPDAAYRTATITLMNEQGGRGRMDVRVDAGGGSLQRKPAVSTAGTTLQPDEAITYAMLLTFAVTAILPTLTVEDPM